MIKKKFGCVGSCGYAPASVKKSTFCQKVTVHKIKNPLHKKSEKVCMCFETRRVRTDNFPVCETNCILIF